MRILLSLITLLLVAPATAGALSANASASEQDQPTRVDKYDFAAEGQNGEWVASKQMRRAKIRANGKLEGRSEEQPTHPVPEPSAALAFAAGALIASAQLRRRRQS